jgi:AAA domain
VTATDPRRADRTPGTPLETVLSKFPDARKVGKSFKATCPLHEDHRPSLGFWETAGPGSKVSLKCRSRGCDIGAILDNVGLAWDDLYPAQRAKPAKAGIRAKPRATRERVWEIKHTDSEVKARHHRIDLGDGKRLWWTQPDGTLGLGGLPVEDLPLYGSELVGPDTFAVILVEGEKAADAMRPLAGELRVVVLATVTGSSGTPGEVALLVLAGVTVYLWPDADDTGYQHMTRIAARLDGVASRRKLIHWPEAEATGDAADFVAAGGSTDALGKLLSAAVDLGSSEVQQTSDGPSLRDGLSEVGLAPAGVPNKPNRIQSQQTSDERYLGNELSEVRFETAAQLLADEALAARREFLKLLGRDGYIPRGEATMLSSYAKVGKTDLMTYAAGQWTLEGRRVLSLTEESRLTWRLRLPAYAGDWSKLTLVYGLGQDPEALLAFATSQPADVVVVDTLRAILQLEDENNNSEIARKLSPWIAAVCRDAGRSLVLLHHHRKQGGESGRGITGGHAFLAAVDVSLELTRVGNSTNRRLLRGQARLAPIEELVYEMKEPGIFEALGELKAIELAAVRVRVREFMLDAQPERKTTSEVRTGLGDPQPSRDQVAKALHEEAIAGHLDRVPPLSEDASGRRVTWGVPTSDETPPIDLRQGKLIGG